MRPNSLAPFNSYIDTHSTKRVGVTSQNMFMANHIGNVSSAAETSPLQAKQTTAIQADSIALHRQLNDVKANKIAEMLGSEALKYHITPESIHHILQEDRNHINAVLTSFSLLNREEITPALIKHTAKVVSAASEKSKAVASQSLSKELQNILAKLPNQANTLKQRFLAEYVTPAIKAKLNENYTDSQLKSMAGLSPEQSVDDATLVTHFLTGSLLQGKTARFDNAMQAYQKHNLWADKNACLEQGFRALEEHIETICLNVPTTPAALSSPESKMTEKPPVTQRNVPLSSAASPQPDDVDGMPYRTSDQPSAPVINNYYITNNYACPHCINKVSDTPSHYANATATVTIDGVTTLPTAQSQTVTPKSAASAADAPTSYRTELHVQLNDEGKTVKGSGSLPQNNVVQTDYNAPSQQPLKDKPSDELSETTRQPVEGKAAPLLQSNQEKQAPVSSSRQQQVGGYTRTAEGKWLSNTQKINPFVLTSRGFNQSTNPLERQRYRAGDSNTESTKLFAQNPKEPPQKAVDGIDDQLLEEHVTQLTDHLFDAHIQTVSNSRLVDTAKQVVVELSNMLDVAKGSAMELKNNALDPELDTQKSLGNKQPLDEQSTASTPLKGHISGVYHAKVAQVVEEQPMTASEIEKAPAEPIREIAPSKEKLDGDTTEKKYRWQVNTDNRVYTTSGGQARDLSRKKHYIGNDQRFKLGSGS
ncbi:hypothetical protein U0L13_002700 [Providencia stuartii]|uniref:hypothetical protein n=1 Tax=Providencia stuartii TaxID=588 RepID=UPI001FF2ACA7|nr:hypothetical protein [Providencia stuartii]ELZ5940459.1 hypothetical protein [Providencia stuartii]MCK1144825.1 hypothetical protein [Providencia stuartii]